jgi:hypothetical protein
VKDNAATNNTGQTIYQYVAVYDPIAGYVTSGGGSISSPAGAYPANPGLTGTTTFTSLLAKYATGATVPTGSTNLSFSAANLTMASSSYKWLVVSGPKAWFRGSGNVTISGVGQACQFLVAVIDGQATGGGGVDKFRIKIWKTDGTVVYDNQMNAPTDAVATQSVTTGTGSVMVLK